MSKRSNKAALKAYPEGKLCKGLFDTNKKRRKFFREGYDIGEREGIERVLNWIEIHSGNYLSFTKTDDYSSANFYTAGMINDCRKDMGLDDKECQAYKDAKAIDSAYIIEDGWIVRVYSDDHREKIKYVGETEVKI